MHRPAGPSVDAPPPVERRWDVEGYDRIDAARLETFAYEYPGSPAVVEIATDEFTAVCPWSGLPDFGRLRVRYLPRERVLELKSFKYYLHSYRNVGIYQEHAANRILHDLVAATQPVWMELVLDYNVRGGVHTTVTVRWPRDREAP
ncbi:MAG: preQ(1) synthase [Firmicutes bacterium]|nr:preQ(1) synthase [Bacillota bacterium]